MLESSAPARRLITDINCLVEVPPGPLRGEQMWQVRTRKDAALLIEDGKITWFGSADEAPEADQRLSAVGGTVIPGLVDPHTHVPFYGQRSSEFVRRIAGESYLSIMQEGGGIRVSMQSVRDASSEQLVTENLPRLRRMLANGVTTCECKSGYGLEVEAELKQLRAIRRLNDMQPIDLIPTYMGAHAVPPEYAGRADDYLDSVTEPAFLRQLKEEGLAEFCDVFCDEGAFDVAQARRVLERAREAGLKLKLHADELEQIGASRLAGETQATSADHLEMIDDGGIEAMLAGGTIAVVLPGTSFYLGIHHCDARRLINAGLPVALATDFNPGSCMIESLAMIMNIACCQLRMMPTEVAAACTANAAAAVGQQDRIGAIARGFEADLVVLDIPTLDEWAYMVGRPHVKTVLKGGRVVYERPEPS